MKLLYDDEKKLGIFLILVILNSFSQIKCNPIHLLDLDKVEKLIELRKESSNLLKKEYAEFRTKFATKYANIEESRKSRIEISRIYNVLKNEIKNIQKSFFNYSNSILDSKFYFNF